MYENPFLILLLMEFVKTDTMEKYGKSKVTVSDIVTYILEKQACYTSGVITKTSFTFSEIARKAWSNRQFDFKIEFLDMLAQASSLFGSYASWADFLEIHSTSHPAMLAETYRDQTVDQLPLHVTLEMQRNVFKFIRIIRRVQQSNGSFSKGTGQFPEKREDFKNEIEIINSSANANVEYLIHLAKSEKFGKIDFDKDGLSIEIH